MKNALRLLVNNQLFLRLVRLLGMLCLLTIATVPAKTYYVATTGSNSAAGTLSQPFATLQKGHDVAVAGDTVFIRGGTYAIKGSGPNANCGIYITKSGTSAAKRIYFWAYQTEIPKFDFAGVTLATTTSAGIRIDGSSWLHFKGLEICNVPQPGGAANNGIWANPASNIIFELCNFHHNKGPGLSIANGTGGNLVLNCDSHENYDPGSSTGDGQNADGFGVHYQKSGASTVVRGCRAWWNSDDGFDCISNNIAVTVENCWFWLNGYKPGTLNTTVYCNGNGCKLGGYGNPCTGAPATLPVNTVRNSVAFLNKATGFDHNFHPGNNFYYNNTAFNNDTNFLMVGYNLSTNDPNVGMGTYKNNIAFSGGRATAKSNGAITSNNSWDISGLTLAASDFLSIDTTGVYGPRKADGSLPDVAFMHLATGSKCIDKGTNVGLSYVGAAPDLGAYEYNAQSSIRIQPLSPETTPIFFSTRKRDLQQVRLFDLTGRRLDNRMIDRALQPVIVRILQPEGRMWGNSVIWLQ